MAMRVSGPMKIISESEEKQQQQRISGVLLGWGSVFSSHLCLRRGVFQRLSQAVSCFQVLMSVAWQWQTQRKTSHLHVIRKRCGCWQRAVLYLTTQFSAAFFSSTQLRECQQKKKSQTKSHTLHRQKGSKGWFADSRTYKISRMLVQHWMGWRQVHFPPIFIVL